MAAKRQDERLKVNDPSLELLQLRDSLTADVATTLAGNTVVQEVIFGSMDARAMALLVQVLRVNSTIEALFFGETDISSDDITVLCETIATSNCQVDHLALTNEKKNINHAAGALARLLAVASPLTSLDLRDNEFSLDTIQQIAIVDNHLSVGT